MEKDNIIELIRKCLALSQSPNENEAARAAEKAQELLFKYNLSISQVETDEKQTRSRGIIRSDINVTSGKNEGKWQIRLAFSIASTHFCELLVSQWRLIFIGEKHNTEVAQELFHWLAIQIKALGNPAWREYQSSERRPVFLRGFYERASARVGYRLWSQWNELRWSSESSTALVVQNSEAIDEFIKERFPMIRKGRSSGSRSLDGHRAGYQAGDRVDITLKSKLNQRNTPQVGG